MRTRSWSLAVHAILLTYVLIAVFPILLVVANALKSRRAIFSDPLSLPTADTLTLKGFARVFAVSDFELYFLNSLTVTVVTLAAVLLFAAMAAWALSEYGFRGRVLLGLFFAIGIMVPIRLGTVSILELMVTPQPHQHAHRPGTGLHRPGTAARHLHSDRVHRPDSEAT